MTISLEYIGAAERYFETASTGKSQSWRRGQTQDVSDTDAALLMGTGLFAYGSAYAQPESNIAPGFPVMATKTLTGGITKIASMTQAEYSALVVKDESTQYNITDGAIYFGSTPVNGLAANFQQAGTGAVIRTGQSKMRERITVADFGAIGDGVVDDTVAIQAAIDYAIYQSALGNKAKGTVYIPSGKYKVSNTLHLGYGDGFRSVRVVGDGIRYAADDAFCGTAISATFNDRPVFAVTGGRGTGISNMTIVGLNSSWVSTNGLGALAAPLIDDTIEANWVDPAFPAAASSRYAPYCAIAIDPYAGSRQAVSYPDVAYPAWLGASAQYNKPYSSTTLIENVQIRGFVVGIANQPCDADGNGDYTKVIGSAIEQCQYGISIGNTQSRLFRISNSTIVNCHTGITTCKHGRQNGKPQILVESTELGGIILWANIPNTSYAGGLRFENCYGELVYSIGLFNSNSRPSSVVFDSCEFSFQSWQTRGVPAFIAENPNGKLVFNSCVFTAGNPQTVFSFNCQSNRMSFNDCTVLAEAVDGKLYEKHAINATGGVVAKNAGGFFNGFSVECYRYNLTTGALVGSFSLNTSTDTSRKYGAPSYLQQIYAKDKLLSAPIFNSQSGTPSINKVNCASLTSSGRAVTLDVTGAIGTEWRLTLDGGDVGDMLYDDVTGTVFFVTSRTGMVLSLLAQNNYNINGTMKVVITKTGNFYVLNCRVYSPAFSTFGDVTAGSAVLSNAGRLDGYNGYLTSVDDGVVIDDYILPTRDWRAVSDANSRVTGVTAGTITLQGAASAGYTQVRKRLELFVRKPPVNNT